MAKVIKAVIPAAGRGTRLYPIAKNQPKETLPIGGKPMIFYALFEAARAELHEVYVVVSREKEPLCRYIQEGAFEKDLMEGSGKSIVCMPRIILLDQPDPLGSGDAVYRARDMLGDEPFALMMPDFFLYGPRPPLIQMIPVYERFGHITAGVVSLGPKEAAGFGNVGIVEGLRINRQLLEIHCFSNKRTDPLKLEAQERIYKIVPRWILGSDFFSYLGCEKGRAKEWDETPALRAMCQEKKALGKLLEGRAFDLGNPVGYKAACLFANTSSVGPDTRDHRD
jgi:UTP--glucose-1-phosphate uridylyltransferase